LLRKEELALTKEEMEKKQHIRNLHLFQRDGRGKVRIHISPSSGGKKKELCELSGRGGEKGKKPGSTINTGAGRGGGGKSALFTYIYFPKEKGFWQANCEGEGRKEA